MGSQARASFWIDSISPSAPCLGYDENSPCLKIHGSFVSDRLSFGQDGQRFHIPQPHRTFARQATLESNRLAMMENYLANFTGPDPMRNALSKMIRSNDVKPMTDRRDGRVYHNCTPAPLL